MKGLVLSIVNVQSTDMLAVVEGRSKETVEDVDESFKCSHDLRAQAAPGESPILHLQVVRRQYHRWSAAVMYSTFFKLCVCTEIHDFRTMFSWLHRVAV